MHGEILIWSNETEFIKINEGTGDNLLREDQEEGYVDYINCDFISYDGTEFVEEDGRMMLLKDLYQDKFHNIPELLHYLIDEQLIPDNEYLVLYPKNQVKGSKWEETKDNV